MKKKLVLAGLVFGLSAMASMPAFAGEWKQNDTGWWYQKDDGTWYSNEWQWLDGNNDGVSECYYFNEDGYCLLDTITPGGYQVNADGAWVKKGVVQVKKKELSQFEQEMEKYAGFTWLDWMDLSYSEVYNLSDETYTIRYLEIKRYAPYGLPSEYVNKTVDDVREEAMAERKERYKRTPEEFRKWNHIEIPKGIILR